MGSTPAISQSVGESNFQELRKSGSSQKFDSKHSGERGEAILSSRPPLCLSLLARRAVRRPRPPCGPRILPPPRLGILLDVRHLGTASRVGPPVPGSSYVAHRFLPVLVGVHMILALITALLLPPEHPPPSRPECVLPNSPRIGVGLSYVGRDHAPLGEAVEPVRS